VHWALVLALVTGTTSWPPMGPAGTRDASTAIASTPSAHVTAIDAAVRSDGRLQQRVLTLHRSPVHGRVVTASFSAPLEGNHEPHRPQVFRRKCPQASARGDTSDVLA
jgi:hypothetical protein